MINKFAKHLLLALLLVVLTLPLVPMKVISAVDVIIDVSVITPTITTLSASSESGSGSTLYGTLDSLGGFSPVYVYFQYGLTTSYGNSTIEQTKSAIEAFNQPISGLTSDTLYHFRTIVRFRTTSYVYGNDVTFYTSAVETPTIVTGEASEIAQTSAILQGTLLTLGEFTFLYVSFEYGETESYGIATTEETRTTIGTFNAPVNIGLASNTLYHFVARVRYDASNYVYGDDNTFTTLKIELFPPTGFVAQREDATIALSWIKDSEAINTMIRRDADSFPDSISSGVQVYFGEEESIIDTGLDNTQAYYYSAWSEREDRYSTTFTTVYSGPLGEGEGILPVPDYVWIGNALVLESYQVTGDQLIVFQYELSYTTEPSQDVKDFFVFELYDGANITASGPVMAWGKRPGSIYLSPSNTLTWEQSFTLKLTGIPGQWGDTIPMEIYSASSPNWTYDRNNLNQLDRWVFTVAETIDSDWIVAVVTGDRLSDEACLIFNKAIRGLSNTRTEICLSGLAYPDYEFPDFIDDGQEALTREKNLGDYINGLLDDSGNLVGMNGDSMGTMIMAFICLILMVIVGAITRNAGWAMISAVPVISFGNYIGLIGLAFTLIIASIIVLYSYYAIWIRGV